RPAAGSATMPTEGIRKQRQHTGPALYSFLGSGIPAGPDPMPVRVVDLRPQAAGARGRRGGSTGSPAARHRKLTPHPTAPPARSPWSSATSRTSSHGWRRHSPGSRTGRSGSHFLAIAAVLALAVHQAVMVALDRVVCPSRVFLRSLVVQTRGVTRIAAVIFAWSAVLPPAPFAPGVASAIAHGLLTALIVLHGWAALIASRIGARLYLMRFRLDAEDNLLARKHVTQVRILHRAADTL